MTTQGITTSVLKADPSLPHEVRANEAILRALFSAVLARMSRPRGAVWVPGSPVAFVEGSFYRRGKDDQAFCIVFHCVDGTTYTTKQFDPCEDAQTLMEAYADVFLACKGREDTFTEEDMGEAIARVADTFGWWLFQCRKIPIEDIKEEFLRPVPTVVNILFKHTKKDEHGTELEWYIKDPTPATVQEQVQPPEEAPTRSPSCWNSIAREERVRMVEEVWEGRRTLDDLLWTEGLTERRLSMFVGLVNYQRRKRGVRELLPTLTQLRKGLGTTEPDAPPAAPSVEDQPSRVVSLDEGEISRWIRGKAD